jgi:hypothetical protein
LTEALASELVPLGIRATLIEAGFFPYRFSEFHFPGDDKESYRPNRFRNRYPLRQCAEEHIRVKDAKRYVEKL